MADRKEIKSDVIIGIHNAILNKYNREHDEKKTKTEFYGFDEEEGSLKTVFQKLFSKDIKEKFNDAYNARKLYDLYNDAKKNDVVVVKIEDKYLNIYLKYLDVETEQEFIQKYGNQETGNSVYYHGYYDGGDDIVKVELSINTDTEVVRSYSISTKTQFEGDVEYVSSHCLINLKSINKKESSVNQRVVNLILYVGNTPIINQEVIIGTFSSISPQNYPFSSLIILKKVENINETLTEDERRICREFLKNKKISSTGMHINAFDSLEKYLTEMNSRWEKNLQILKKMQGNFVYYSNNGGQSCYNKGVIKIYANGRFTYKDSNSIKNKGEVIVLNGKNVILAHETKEGLLSYYAYVKLHSREINTMTGVFVGVNNNNGIVSNGIYFKRLEDEKFEDLTFENLEYNDSELLKLKTEDRDFEKYLFRNCDEDMLLIKPSSRIDLAEYEGYYSLFYSSSRSTRTIIRESFLYITKDGKCSLTYKSLDTLNGQVRIVRDLMYILLKTNDDFFGIITLPLDDRLLKNKILGTLSAITTDRSPIVRKIALIKRLQENKEITVSKEIKINSKEFNELNDKYDGLANLLTGRIDNYIKVPKTLSFKQEINYGTHFYNSACFAAQNENYEEAKNTLKIAFTHGFNDKKAILKQMKEGCFKEIKKDILEYLRLANLD
jgi:hypothetical protein